MRIAAVFALAFQLPFSDSNAEETDWDAVIAKAEAPMTSFREKYKKALKTARETAQKGGKDAEVAAIAEELKAFEAGGVPDGQSTNPGLAKIEATFLMHYMGIHSKVWKNLSALATKHPSGAGNDRIRKRIEHWEIARFTIQTSKTPFTWVWRTKGSPIPPSLSTPDEPKTTARKVLEQYGVPFGEGASAIYDPQKSELVVRNTLEAMVLIDVFLKHTNLK